MPPRRSRPGGSPRSGAGGSGKPLLAAVLMSATAFVVCFLTNAPPDFSRVFYTAEALCDLLLIADAVWLAQTVARRARA